MYLYILAGNEEALISFSSNFLSNGSDPTQRLLHPVDIDHLHHYYYQSKPVTYFYDERIVTPNLLLTCCTALPEN
ncbi:hypothetical protein BpHYR1_031701 [Brachionus plicatilis]|uniref:Uncharacterized protein n=1 Tax=Brachionus plicatilis TaxID=10195 RepID=A0A3M7QP10_BRAPC|nr:hypothetical protein BpHYR1_031701 [Brachionus plicatilis]